EMTFTERGAQYDIVVRKSVGFSARLMRLVSLPFTMKTAARGLRDAHELLLQRYADLEAARSGEHIQWLELRRANETAVRQATELRLLAHELTMTEQRERTRLAEILHDDLQQLLVAAKFKVSALAPLGSGPTFTSHVEEVQELLT